MARNLLSPYVSASKKSDSGNRWLGRCSCVRKALLLSWMHWSLSIEDRAESVGVLLAKKWAHSVRARKARRQWSPWHPRGLASPALCSLMGGAMPQTLRMWHTVAIHAFCTQNEKKSLQSKRKEQHYFVGNGEEKQQKPWSSRFQHTRNEGHLGWWQMEFTHSNMPRL